MSVRPNSAASRDIAYHLHPYTNARKNEEEGSLILDRGDGVYVIDDEGNRYLEAMAGLWCAGLGFSEKRLVDAATKQMSKLPFYHSFAQKTATPVVDLAEKLFRAAHEQRARSNGRNFTVDPALATSMGLSAENFRHLMRDAVERRDR